MSAGLLMVRPVWSYLTQTSACSWRPIPNMVLSLSLSLCLSFSLSDCAHDLPHSGEVSRAMRNRCVEIALPLCVGFTPSLLTQPSLLSPSYLTVGQSVEEHRTPHLPHTLPHWRVMNSLSLSGQRPALSAFMSPLHDLMVLLREQGM